VDGIGISIAHTQEDFFRLIRLREEVFVLEQQIPIEIELDDDDHSATHLVAKSGREVIGTARLVVRGTEGKVGRMAVRKAWRRRTVGEKLIGALVPIARELGATALVLHAQLQAAPFYEKHGFRSEGSSFQEAGIAHVRMRRVIQPG